jgi:hypothetical protein
MISRNAFVSALLLILAAFGAVLGLYAGLLATFQLGIALHGQYDYFASGSPVGAALMGGGAALGAGVPLIVRALLRKGRAASDGAR